MPSLTGSEAAQVKVACALMICLVFDDPLPAGCPYGAYSLNFVECPVYFTTLLTYLCT